MKFELKEINTTSKSKKSKAYGVLISKYLFTILANMTVPAVVPPANTMTPIPTPTHVPPKLR